MKPIKLTLTAYGAFANKTVLDFKEELNQSDIFVVTGPTGAGKTTIFEAICYALYGESSGNNRKGEDIRSHYVALDGPMTEVEFEFSVKGKHYYIRRYPKQQVPKKRGTGYTDMNGGVEFKDLDLPLDILTKDGDVKEAVQSIIGLTPDQFRKIVMIPQGEFKEFLMAGTSDKEIILRQIFGTELYKKFQEKLKEETNLLEKDVKEKQKEIEIKLDSFQCLNNETLKELIKAQGRTDLIIESCENQLKSSLVDIDRLSNEINSLQAEEAKHRSYYEVSSKINDEFKKLEKVTEILDTLSLQKHEIEAKKTVMNDSKLALEIEFLENNYHAAVASLEKVVMLKAAEEQNFTMLQPKLNEATKNHDLVSTLSLELKQKEQQLTELKSYETDVVKLMALVKQIQSHELKKQEFNASMAVLTKEMKQSEADVLLIPSKQEMLYEVKTALTQNKVTLTEAQSLQKSLVGLKEKNEQLLKTQKQLADALAIHSIKQEAEQKLKEKYQYEAALFMNEAAINLAKKLQVNMPCPVCGSTTHPNIAYSDTIILTEAELDLLRQQVDDATKEVGLAYASVSSLETSVIKEQHQIEELGTQLSEKLTCQHSMTSDVIDEQWLAVLKNLDILSSEREQLIAQEITLTDWLTQAKVKESQLKVLTEKLELLKASVEQNDRELTVANAKVADLQGRVPESYRQLEFVTQEIQQLEKAMNELALSIESYLATFKKYSDEAIRLQATLKQLDQTIEDETQKLKQSETIFNSAVKDKFKHLEAYVQAKQSKADIQALETSIVTYEQDVFAANKSYQELKEALKDQQIIDLSEVLASINEVVSSIATAREKRTQLEIAYQDNHKLLTSVKKLYALISEKELKYKVIADLSKLSNGNSSGQMSFETYVLSSYFDEVLEQANRRLEKMTAKRYYLLRREEVKGNGRKGLDLDVFDTHTSKARQVKTLSGGESFKASLALALGLSDTVQHHAGGIQLDTMFIDEGFGTLDSESLDQAIDILMELQDHGRLIGVISHVSELKERIPAKLIVEQTTAGSCAYFKK